jgi:hypothetical protein
VVLLNRLYAASETVVMGVGLEGISQFSFEFIIQDMISSAT